MIPFRVPGAVLGVATTLALAVPLVAAPARADSFSFQYNWSDGQRWGAPPVLVVPDRWERRHRRPPGPPVVRDRYGRTLGYLVPSPYGPVIVERSGRHGPPGGRGRGRGWGPPPRW